MATYTELSPTEFSGILAAYGLSFVDAEAIEGGMANSSFLVNGNYVLTVLDNHDLDSAQELARTMEYLAQNGLKTPTPLTTLKGEQLYVDSGRIVMLKPYVRTLICPESDEWKRARGIGGILAVLHQIPAPSWLGRRARRIPRQALRTLNGWACADLKSCLNLIEAAQIEAMLDSFPDVLCHGDLMGDNVLDADDGSLRPIDWETASVDSALLDVGISGVSAVKNGLEVEPFLSDIMVGYNDHSSLMAPTADEVLKATAYGCALMSYHRFVRQNITYPNSEKARIYKELLPFIEEVLG